MLVTGSRRREHHLQARVEAFRAYAAHPRTPQFAAAFARVLAESERSAVAVMCSESVWWRCHRRLIADVAVVGHGARVCQLLPDGLVNQHQPSVEARLTPDDVIVWDRS